MEPIDTTAASSSKRSSRLTMVCKPMIICAEVVTGSTLFHGYAPWACLPLTTILNGSTAAMIPPWRYRTLPTSVLALICSPNIASTSGFLSTPSSTMTSAPPRSPRGAPSSAGWKINFTLPCNSFFIPVKISAAPINMATWVSCPHACITGTMLPSNSAVLVDL